MSGTGVWRRPRKGGARWASSSISGSIPATAPTGAAPRAAGSSACSGTPAARGEIAFYCPGCDWNASVTDVDEARGVPSGGPLRYLDGDALVTLGGRFGLVENTADL